MAGGGREDMETGAPLIRKTSILIVWTQLKPFEGFVKSMIGKMLEALLILLRPPMSICRRTNLCLRGLDYWRVCEIDRETF